MSNFYSRVAIVFSILNELEYKTRVLGIQIGSETVRAVSIGGSKL